MVAKSSILLGAEAENLAQEFISNQYISNWQRLAPAHANAVRILIIVAGNQKDYDNAMRTVMGGAGVAYPPVIWRDEDYLTYGNPNDNEWMPELTIPPLYVVPA
jgi:hypothetical protein